MRIRDYKITYFNFLPYECIAAEEYLDRMAEKGWLLQSIKGTFLIFKKIVPQKMKYSVDVLHNASIFDHKDTDAALEYREYCQTAGWNYICQKGKIQIFYTENNNNTISIHTDEKEKFNAVFKASRYYVRSQFFLIFISIFNLNMQLFIGNTDFTLGSNLGILAVVATVSLVFINSIELISFFLWVIKARSKLKENKFMPYSSYRQLRMKNIFKNTYGIIMLIILLIFSVPNNQGGNGFNISIIGLMFIPIIIMWAVHAFINKKKYSRNINRAITVFGTVVSIYLVIGLTGGLVLRSINTIEQDNVPTKIVSLTLSDFGFKEEAKTSPDIIYDDKSILAKNMCYFYTNGDKGFDYTMFKSQYPWVIKFDEDRLLSRLNGYGLALKLEETNLPSVIRVYSDSKRGTFVFLSKDKIVKFHKDFSGISDEDFLNKVYEKLFK